MRRCYPVGEVVNACVVCCEVKVEVVEDETLRRRSGGAPEAPGQAHVTTLT